MKNTTTILALLLTSCALLSGCNEEDTTAQRDTKSAEEPLSESLMMAITSGADEQPALIAEPVEYVPNLSGQYLASQFAQNRYDWKAAGERLDDVLKETPDAPKLLKMSMVLAAGSGDVEKALEVANKISGTDDSGALAPLFELVGIVKSGDIEKTASFAKTMPRAGLSEFIHPLIKSWADAGNGEYDISRLQSNTIHLKHAVLISDYLGKKEDIQILLLQSISAHNISVGEIETIADTYTHIGDNDKAIKLYEEIYKQVPQNKNVKDKLEALEAGNPIEAFRSVESPSAGIALAMTDMSRLLYQEGGDDSAKIFAHLALYLNPDDQDPLLILGSLAEQNERYEDAADYYSAIKPEHKNYMDAQRQAAETLDNIGDTEGAVSKLRNLADNHGDVESLITIGDLYRQKEDFKKAVSVYSEAETRILEESGADKVPTEYWHLLYMRGMAYEQSDQWKKAERDLQGALDLQPDHPYVLNYLGYAWADQGENLERSLEMIAKAVDLQPDDGYITDSSVWFFARSH